jgi:uncharacterized Ntn-hydrolase superfamily protein
MLALGRGRHTAMFRSTTTFSIAARDPGTGDLGIAVESKHFAVGVLVPWLAGGVGAIATQAWTNTDFGPDGLALLNEGLSAAEALEELIAGDEGREKRQVGIVDADGNVANFTGAECLEWAGAADGDGYTVQGNLLASSKVIAAMASAYEASSRPFPERLLAALRAGQAAGGDVRGQQSAALVVVRDGKGKSGFNDRVVDLRVDDHPSPIEELARLLELHRKAFGH